MFRSIFLLLLFLLLVSCTAVGEAEPSGNMTDDMQNVAVIWPGADESVDAQPVLQWEAFPEAAQYQVIIVNGDTNETVFTQKTTEMVMPVMPPLPGGVRYTWTVQAQDANGEVMGEVHSFFRVKDGLTAVWPANGESVDSKPILQWEAFPGVSQYNVIVVDDDAYPPAVVFDQLTAETMMEVTPALELGSFSWTVRGIDEEGGILAELNSQFLVKALMQIVEPANLATTSATPALSWQPFTGAVSYQVVLLDDDAYPPVVMADEETKETTFAVTTALEPGSYSWTVWAKDANGTVIAEANNQFMVEK
ncbi:MAG: hypothetical protein KJ069_07020 [Anaerolineae bacterium]|nr:hypothetical protein [Anaerolineae bacterium]